jgi:hypothetical protein
LMRGLHPRGEEVLLLWTPRACLCQACVVFTAHQSNARKEALMMWSGRRPRPPSACPVRIGPLPLELRCDGHVGFVRRAHWRRGVDNDETALVWLKAHRLLQLAGGWERSRQVRRSPEDSGTTKTKMTTTPKARSASRLLRLLSRSASRRLALG